MKLIPFSGTCDICGKGRGAGINHAACSKKRQAKGLAGKPSETERLAAGRWAQTAYVKGNWKPPE